jgi:DNA-directed RNA polymerase specialized sigma24 family protein
VIEDVLQEIYLAIWRSADSCRGTARASRWIFQTAHHRMIDAQRARAQREARTHIVRDECNDEDNEGSEANAVVLAAVPSHEDAVVDRLILAEAM